MLNILKRARSNAEESITGFNKRRRLDISSFISTLTLANLWNPQSFTPFTRHYPVDILLVIFEIIIEDHSAQPNALLNRSAPPQVVLASVCKEWQHLVNSTRRHWSHIPAGCSISYVSRCLTKSPGLPLRLGIKLSVNSRPEHGQPDLVKQAREALKPFTRGIVTGTGMGRALSIKRVSELAISISSSIASQIGRQTHSEAERYNLCWAVPELFPSLRNLRLDGVYLPEWYLRLPRTLLSLDLNLIDSPQRTIQMGEDDPRLTLAHFLPHLRSLDHLYRLTIDFSNTPYYENLHLRHNSILIPALHEIRLTARSVNVFYAMSCAIDLPALRRCVLSLHYAPGSVPIKRFSLDCNLQSMFRNFIKQLSSAGTHLRTLYLARRRTSSTTTTTSIVASAEPVDWTNTYATRDTLCQNANLRVTLTCDTGSPSTSDEVEDAFLCALVSCVRDLGHFWPDAPPITSLAVSFDDGCLFQSICRLVSYDRCLPLVNTLACYDDHEGALVGELYAPQAFPGLKMLITPDIEANPEAKRMMAFVLRKRAGLSHTQFDRVAAGVLRDAVMRAAT
ncbi:hypothetical protein PENSPDRAFT_759682 [Peniophora sp. CONT]|nr:hypothetical protein PENSPDRAFT_759682 [Peniophora sp. CONT]